MTPDNADRPSIVSIHTTRAGEIFRGLRMVHKEPGMPLTRVVVTGFTLSHVLVVREGVAMAPVPAAADRLSRLVFD